jgi:hypothetical protein
MHDLTVASLTLFSAVVAFLISQYFLKFVFEPLSRVRRTLADISSAALFYQAKITNGHADEQVALEFRKLSSTLRAALFEVRFYSSMAKVAGVPPAENVRRACQQMNLVSTGMNPAAQKATPDRDYAEWNTKALYEVGDLLGIQTKY